MILEEIKFTNFRCFHGEASIRFSKDTNKNVTIIYAENGFGKTTILNALLWCFFGTTTERFEKSEDILNYDAASVGKSNALVEVFFKHNNNKYAAKRYSQPMGSTNRTFFVTRFYDDGDQKTIDAPDTFINTVIPQEMAPYFLFDGEDAEFLTKQEIGRAVRDILGCSLIENAIEDLVANSIYYRKKIPSDKKTDEIEKIKRKREENEKTIDRINSLITKLEQKSREIAEQIKDIEKKLLNSQNTKGLQREREQCEKELAEAKKRQSDYELKLYKWLGENGRFFVSEKVICNTQSILSEHESKGQIPSPYNEEFVDELLASKECVCGRKLDPDSQEYKKVETLKLKGANHSMRDRMIKIRSCLGNLTNNRSGAQDKLVNAIKGIRESNQKIEKLEMRIADISEKLQGSDISEIVNREQARNSLIKERSDNDVQIGRKQKEKEDLQKENKALDDALTRATSENEKAKKINGLKNLCLKIVETLKQKLKFEEEYAREFLKSSINKILESTTHKELWLDMTEDYRLSLVNNKGVALPKSSGENQLLGLAFTCALIKFAKERKNIRDYCLLSGTIAPLVLDSPFGQLDNDYRKSTATFIPKMAHQVILLVADSQGTDNVINAMKDHIGSEYLLVWHDNQPRKDNESAIRRINGRDYKIVVQDDVYKGTEILDLQNSNE